MRKPRFLPALPGLPGPSLPVIVLSFPAAWQSPGAGTAESGLLHPHHPPGLSGEAEAQECPVCAHGAGQERCHHMGEGHHGAARGTGESCPGLPWESVLKVRRQNLHSEGREAEPCSVPSCCPARAQWQVSPLSCPCLVPAVPLGGHGAPERAQLSLHSAGSSKVSQHSCFSLTQARSCVPCPLRHNVPAWRLRGSSQDSAVVEAERGPCVTHFALFRV